MTSPEPGRDFIGVGVGAMVFDAAGRVFAAKRGPGARNEVGCWEFPGGMVGFGETLEAAVHREFTEEYGMTVEVCALLGVADHILSGEAQHWVSVSYLARHAGGTPRIRETDKCLEIGWFEMSALPQPLSSASRLTLAGYQERPDPR